MGYAERGDEMALAIFEQQAMAIGRMFTIASNFTDPDAYFVGGGVVETEPHFRDWFLATVSAAPTSGRSSEPWRSSPWSRTWTWPALAVLPWPRCTPSRGTLGDCEGLSRRRGPWGTG